MIFFLLRIMNRFLWKCEKLKFLESFQFQKNKKFLSVCFILQSFWANFESCRLKLYNSTDFIPSTLSSAFYLPYCRMTTTLSVLYDISALSKEGFISFSLLILLIWLISSIVISNFMSNFHLGQNIYYEWQELLNCHCHLFSVHYSYELTVHLHTSWNRF